jgi:carbonic anhydrase
LITRPGTRLTAAVLVVALIIVACDRASVSPVAATGSPPSSAPSTSGTPSPAPATAVPAGTTVIPSASASFGAYDWSYQGATGPEHWAELDPSYYACKYGVMQNPIELAGADEGREADPVFDYRAGPTLVVDEWNTIMAVPHRRDTQEEHNTVEVHGIAYNLSQLQFHIPPEHVIYGAEPAAAEVQFVHQLRTDVYTIVAMMVVEGPEDNAAWAPYVDAISAAVASEGVTVTLDWPNLIPIEPEMVSWRFDGSLTAPPCSERVDWIFFEKPIELSAAQIAKMRAAYDGNARPLQQLGYYRSVTHDLKDD